MIASLQITSAQTLNYLSSASRAHSSLRRNSAAMILPSRSLPDSAAASTGGIGGRGGTAPRGKGHVHKDAAFVH